MFIEDCLFKATPSKSANTSLSFRKESRLCPLFFPVRVEVMRSIQIMICWQKVVWGESLRLRSMFSPERRLLFTLEGLELRTEMEDTMEVVVLVIIRAYRAARVGVRRIFAKLRMTFKVVWWLLVVEVARTVKLSQMVVPLDFRTEKTGNKVIMPLEISPVVVGDRTQAANLDITAPSGVTLDKVPRAVNTLVLVAEAATMVAAGRIWQQVVEVLTLPLMDTIALVSLSPQATEAPL